MKKERKEGSEKGWKVERNKARRKRNDEREKKGRKQGGKVERKKK